MNTGQMVWASPYNLLPEIIGEPLNKHIKIYDTTLRDGEQTIGVAFGRYEKLEIAQLLEEAGVERIEAGMPVVSREDFKAVQLIVNNVSKSEVWGFCRCVRTDIDACLDAGVRHVICEIPISDYKLKAYGFQRGEVLDRLVEHIQYAKGQGLYTAFFAVDATRADLEYMREAFVRAVRDGGADEVVLVDTLGVANPETMSYLTRQLRGWVNVPIMVHCHNDLGMATMCTLASVREGAMYAHVTVNGLGEKTGNADLAEVLLAGSILYGISSAIDWQKLRSLSSRIAQISRVPISPLKPVVGSNVFKRESGVAVAQLATYPPAVEGYAPELVGGTREVILSKKSGRASIEYALRERGLSASPEQVEEILKHVKELGVRKGEPLNDAEFERIINLVLYKEDGV